MADSIPTTDELRVRVETVALLSSFFPKWLGDAPEPALVSAPRNKPAPAARALVLA
jgi:hypothetical protein